MYSQYTKSSYRTKSKYKNQTKRYDGKTFDSIREANHYEELLWRQKAGEIKEIICQYKIDIKVEGHHVCFYYVDFKVILSDDSIELHEVKGMVLPLWQLKWKLLEILIDDIEPGAELLVIK